MIRPLEAAMEICGPEARRNADTFAMVYVACEAWKEFPTLVRNAYHESTPIILNWGYNVVVLVSVMSFPDADPVIEFFMKRGYVTDQVQDNLSGREISMECPGNYRTLTLRLLPVPGSTCVKVRDYSKDKILEGFRYECSPIAGVEEVV